MVFNSEMVLTVAHASADMWQYLSCIPSPDRVSSHQLLDLVCCFPLQQLGRFALCLWTFLCLPPPDSLYAYSYYDSSDSDSDFDHHDHDHHHHHHHDHHRDAASSSSTSTTVDLDAYYYHSHSD
ncbi:hypothetical protein ACOSQ2_017867 [Xanthoceras sorbifolium]